MNAEPISVEAPNRETEPIPQPNPSKERRSLVLWLVGCVGGGGVMLLALLAWGHWQFGSLANTLAYLSGERVLVDPKVLSFGTVRRNEERDLHTTIRNRTGKSIKILGSRSSCTCMTTEQSPFSIADGGQRELAIHIVLNGKEDVFENRIVFYTDDEANSVIPVTVRGRITK